MAGSLPIDAAENIQIADQLNGSLSVFWHDAPFPDDWLPTLQQVTVADGGEVVRELLA